MAYVCPRCGKPVQRRSSTAAGVWGGLVGALIFAAFAPFQCDTCGKITTNEFPPEARSKIRIGSIAMVGGAIMLVIVVVGVLVYFGGQ